MNRGHQRRRCSGFTLLEMLITITILAVVASVVTPMFSDDNRLRLLAASSVIASDIELAQVMTISYPDQPVVVRFDASKQMYWLAYTLDPETPILRENTGEPYVVVIGQGRASSAQHVGLTIADMTNDGLEFAASGGLAYFTAAPKIELSRNGAALTLTISQNTGSITEHEWTIAELAKK
jgi:prepilin-type N-terminal cleavage/methylation domain-containing protein